MYIHSMETIHRSLSAQVAVGTFFMKSPVALKTPHQVTSFDQSYSYQSAIDVRNKLNLIEFHWSQMVDAHCQYLSFIQIPIKYVDLVLRENKRSFTFGLYFILHPMGINTIFFNYN